jgi:hypothetical protein
MTATLDVVGKHMCHVDLKKDQNAVRNSLTEVYVEAMAVVGQKKSTFCSKGNI